MKHLTLIIIVALMSCCSLIGRSLEIDTNRVAEWSCRSNKSYENPFSDVDLHMEVTRPDGSTVLVPGYWAGENEWRFRYASPSQGLHKFRTICSDASNTGLHGKTGSISVINYSGNNPLYKHGPLRIHSNNRYLIHQDGTPFLWLADSWWHGMTTRFAWPADFKFLTSDRKEKGFSVIQFAIAFPCDIAPFDERGQNEAGNPWDEDLSSINPEYWNLVDERVEWLVEQGLIPNIVGIWGYYMKFFGVEKIKQHWDYVMARYGAYPVTWTLCGESTLAYYTDLADNWNYYKAQFRQQWSLIAQHIQASDPFDRLLTVHPGPGIRDGIPAINDMDSIDIVLGQPGHSGFDTLLYARNAIADFLVEYPEKPVMHGEVCFEGMHGGGSGEKVQRFLFWTDMLSGTCGFSYGAEGIWQFNTEDQKFGMSPGGNNWGNIPWNVAARYNGSAHVGVGKKILERYEWWRLEPTRSPHENFTTGDLYDPYVARIGEELQIVYLYKFINSRRIVELAGFTPNATYKLTYYDPLTGDAYEQGIRETGTEGTLRAPSSPIMQDWVLVIEKSSK